MARRIVDDQSRLGEPPGLDYGVIRSSRFLPWANGDAMSIATRRPDGPQSLTTHAPRVGTLVLRTIC